MSGVKSDQDKPPIYRGVFALFPRAMEAVAAVSNFGATKYSWTNWRDVPDGVNRYSDALLRHLGSEAKGEVLDADTRLPTAWSTAWNALARLELMLIEEENERLKQVQRYEAETGPASACRCGEGTYTEPRSSGPSLTSLPTEDRRRQEKIWQ